MLFGCAIARELRGGGFAQTMTALTIALAPGLIGIAYGLSTEFLSPAAWTALIYLTMRLVKTQIDALLPSDRARGDGRALREIFDRCVRARACDCIARRRPGCAAALAMARCSGSRSSSC